MLLRQIRDGLGEQYLSTMTRCHNTGATMHVQAHIAALSVRWFACMDSHPHAHNTTFGPIMIRKRLLRVCRSGYSRCGTGKNYKEGVALSIHLISIMRCENGAQYQAMLLQN